MGRKRTSATTTPQRPKTTKVNGQTHHGHAHAPHDTSSGKRRVRQYGALRRAKDAARSAQLAALARSAR